MEKKKGLEKKEREAKSSSWIFGLFRLSPVGTYMSSRNEI
jgi:hypothetical protein